MDKLEQNFFDKGNSVAGIDEDLYESDMMIPDTTDVFHSDQYGNIDAEQYGFRFPDEARMDAVVWEIDDPDGTTIKALNEPLPDLTAKNLPLYSRRVKTKADLIKIWNHRFKKKEPIVFKADDITAE
jgi:hypothetical protein